MNASELKDYQLHLKTAPPVRPKPPGHLALEQDLPQQGQLRDQQGEGGLSLPSRHHHPNGLCLHLDHNQKPEQSPLHLWPIWGHELTPRPSPDEERTPSPAPVQLSKEGALRVQRLNRMLQLLRPQTDVGLDLDVSLSPP
ncbi:hypothetical protein EMCRGX_G005446 [Ephydatia muelleri]